MKVRTFIDRPILSGVISVMIVIIGIICLINLPIEQFPDIAPPTVRVSATYTGANAETVMKSVITPLEEAINGVENMTYMTSTATNNGSATISVYFKQGTDGDMAMVNVQNCVSQAQGKLPADVTKSGVTVRKRLNSTLKELSIYSPDDSFDKIFLTNYMKINVEPRLSRIPGVGDVGAAGSLYALRIWLDPLKMAQYGLVPDDIDDVLSEQNIESPTGTLGAESDRTFRYVLKYRGQYEDVPDYENMIVKALPNGDILRVKDIARVEMGTENYNMLSQTNGHPGGNCNVQQTSGSNANEIINEVDAVMDEIRADLPKGIEIADVMSVKDYLDASIKSVVETLLVAILLVIIVVYLFLHDLRATVIPSLAIVVSLIGTFAFIYIVGFSLNLLTLFALVLVIGTVVDDAIVVTEAVQAKFDEGYTNAYDATIAAMDGLTSALFTTTTVFMAVFIPVSFLGGTSGTFYTQFGLTMAVAVAISLLNALTLCPALCALIMRPKVSTEQEQSSLPELSSGRKLDEVKENGAKTTARVKKSFSESLADGFDNVFHNVQNKYNKGAYFLLKHKLTVAIAIIVVCAALGTLLKVTKTGLVPQEDMGTINMVVQLSPGSNLETTEKVMDEIAEAIKDVPQIKIWSRVTGRSSGGDQSASSGSYTIRLLPWDERRGKGDDLNSVMEDIYARTAHITQATIRLSTRPMITGYGQNSGFELHVQDRQGGTTDDLFAATNSFIDALNKRPEISRAYTNFNTNYPQYMIDVDAAKCKRVGVSPSDVLSVLSGYIGGSYSSNLNRFTKLLRVMVQASPEFRMDLAALDNIFVRTSDGEMSPISQYITLTKVYGSETLSRFNLFPSIAVQGTPASGYSSGQAIKAISEVAEEVLPEGYGFEFAAMTREEASATGTTAVVFVICIVFVYLIMCALYESFLIPFAVILAVPFGLLGSFLFATIWGLENNIYMQIGLIMLIGLLSKTAILLTEYASTRRRAGMTIAAAAMSAAKARLRPILMTSLTMIFGMLPLMFAHGVGANGNMSVGVTTVGGMLLGTIGILFAVPTLFIIFQYVQERVKMK